MDWQIDWRADRGYTAYCSDRRGGYTYHQDFFALIERLYNWQAEAGHPDLLLSRKVLDKIESDIPASGWGLEAIGAYDAWTSYMTYSPTNSMNIRRVVTFSIGPGDIVRGFPRLSWPPHMV